jgi:hypothetical protein
MPAYKKNFIFKFGQSTDVDGVEDVWDGAGDTAAELQTYNWPSAAATTTIVSSDSADVSTSIGASEVKVIGLDDNLFHQHEYVTLNGVTPVQLVNDYKRVHRANVTKVGSNGVNVGEIDIRHGAGVVNTIARIDAGNGQTLMAVYTVPKNWRNAWIRSWTASVRSDGATARAATLQFLTRGESSDASWQVKDVCEVHSNGGAASIQYSNPIPISPGSDIRICVVAISSANANVVANFELEYTE